MLAPFAEPALSRAYGLAIHGGKEVLVVQRVTRPAGHPLSTTFQPTIRQITALTALAAILSCAAATYALAYL
eukprot:scaffold195075_cov21-Prasinocladus_malaysianus.AAC.3